MKKVFLSYGRADAADLADRLAADLALHEFAGDERCEPWKDRAELKSGTPWGDQIVAALRTVDVVVAVLSPHSVRSRSDGGSTDDSVCLDEISYARFGAGKPIVPVMAIRCTPPFEIFRLDYVDFTHWQDRAAYGQALEKLLDSVAAALRGEYRYRFWKDRLQPWDFGEFLEQKRAGFVGRDWLFREIEGWLKDPKQPAMLVVGEPGLGKSAIVAEYLHRNPDARVLAFHCCQSAVEETLQPGRFVRSIAAMIASRHPAYEQMLDRPPYRDLLGEASCNRDPASAFESAVLAALAQAGPPSPGRWTLVVDALDEALTPPPGARTDIVTLLAARIDRFPAWLSLVATSRPQKAVLDRLAALRPRILDAGDPQNLGDLARYIATRLDQPVLTGQVAASGKPREWAIDTLNAVAKGNFLYAQRALDSIERGVLEVAELGTLPPGLSEQYQFFFDRQFREAAAWAAAEPVFAALVAAQDVIGVDELAAATGLDPKIELPRVLAGISSYLRATADRSPKYQLFHKSLVEWLTENAEQGRHYAIDRSRGHRLLADGLFARYAADRFTLSAYALAHLPRHLAQAASEAQAGDRAELQQRLADLVLDLVVQGQRVNDPSGMDASIRLALHTVAAGPAAASAPLALRLALGWEAFRRERLDASRLFELARDGRLSQMEQELQLYAADEQWTAAARLVAAWLAQPKDPAGADALRRKVRSGIVLDERVDAIFESRPAIFPAIGSTVDEGQTAAILAHAGGVDAERGINPSMLWDQAAPPPAGERVDPEGVRVDPEGVRYLAEFESPVFVAFAQADPQAGTARLREYIALHVANAYREYRNGSLWQVLSAVARHRDIDWVRDMAPSIISAALAGGSREFGGASSITLLGLHAAKGQPAQLDAAEQAARQAAAALEPAGGRSDSWGDHLRTFCALAETRALLLGDNAGPLLQQAAQLPPGYAGFQAPARLTLAESLAIGKAPRPQIESALKDARRAADNVQDLVFCARTVSRVNGLMSRWLGDKANDPIELSAVIDRFARDPQAPEFAAVHVVGEQYPDRKVVNPTSRLPGWLLEARTLDALATAYQWRLDAFLGVNAEVGGPAVALADGTRIRVPDGRWAPMLAAYLSAGVLRTAAFKPAERVRLIMKLVPLAIGNPTALDTVLARLLLALRPADEAVLESIATSLQEYQLPQQAETASALAPA